EALLSRLSTTPNYKTKRWLFDWRRFYVSYAPRSWLLLWKKRHNGKQVEPKVALLQQLAAQNHERHIEINDESSYVDQRRDERRRGCGRIESETTQQKRKHGAADRAPGDHTHKRARNRHCDEPMVWPVIEDVQFLPGRDSQKSDRAEDQAQ